MGLVRVRFTLLLALPFLQLLLPASYLQAIRTASTCVHRRKTAMNNAVLLCHCDSLLTRLVFWQAFSFWGTFPLWCAADLKTIHLATLAVLLTLHADADFVLLGAAASKHPHTVCWRS